MSDFRQTTAPAPIAQAQTLRQAGQSTYVTQNDKPPPADAPTYKVMQKSYIGGAIVQEGAVIKYGGRPGSNLEHVSGPKWENTEAGKEYAAEQSKKNSASSEIETLRTRLADLQAELERTTRPKAAKSGAL